MTFEEFWENAYYKDTFGTSEPYYGMAHYAFEVGQENAIQWHDLRKNPDDLPKEDCEVITIHQNNKKNFQKWKNGAWINAIVIPVIAWCEIPKFEEEQMPKETEWEVNYDK